MPHSWKRSSTRSASRTSRSCEGRVEDVHGAFDACVARAFSSPSATWEAAQPLLDPRGVLVYWAGEGFDRGPLDELGVPIRLSTRSDLARTGPLVIMGPQ